jgi:hypothetical protein
LGIENSLCFARMSEPASGIDFASLKGWNRMSLCSPRLRFRSVAEHYVVQANSFSSLSSAPFHPF